jgi:hypothetical protein
MKTLTTLFALAIFCATACGQTIKSLGYNTTSGEVVANTGTNVLTFTNGAIAVSDTEITSSGLSWASVPKIDLEQSALVDENNTVVANWDTNGFSFAAAFIAEPLVYAQMRTNLGLPLPALTNTSNADMLSALGAAQTIFTVKTNDQTIIDETNATTITDLTFVTEPGARYVVTFVPIVENGAFMQVIASNALVFGSWNQVGTAFASTNPITNETTIGATGTLRSPVQVFYVEGGTNAGAISATFRGAITNTTNTIKAGSFLRADKMP